MRIPTAFVFGALAATLVAAAAFRGAGQPVDSTFTYQGQLRNAGQLVNGNVDVRFTLWDSDVGGTQVGNANSFTNYPLTDGRFALGLNFGNGAFNGDQRWVQVEFRSPAGVGQYLTLNPRDKIMATPYALYALNGTASQWDYNPKTQSLTAAANVSKVGIGTSTPTAALEVVSATGGDDAVKLPAGSVGIHELAESAFIRALDVTTKPTMFTTNRSGFLVFSGTAGNTGSASVIVDGKSFPFRYHNGGIAALHSVIPLPSGEHSLQVWIATSYGQISATAVWYPAY
jgi:hypothetical protein